MTAPPTSSPPSATSKVPASSPSFFVASDGQLSRRPVDALTVGIGLLLTLVSARMAGAGSALEKSLLDVPSHLPPFVTALFNVTYGLGAAYSVVVAAIVLITAPRRGRLVPALALAVGLALAGAVVGSVIAGEGLPDLAPQPEAVLSGETFPTVRLAAVAAALLVLRPWVIRGYGRLHSFAVAVLCVSAWAIGIAGPPDVLGALGVGLTAAGVVLVLLGSPGGHPTVGQVVSTLRALGIVVDDLRFATRQPWGVRLLRGLTPAGRELLIKVYGRDATDAHRAARWSRTLLYRDRSSPGATRLQLVEHEALVTILAERAGVRVTRVIAAAEAQGDAVLVLDQPPRPLLDRVDSSTEPLSQRLAQVLTDDVARAQWRAVGRLRAADLCHGELTLEKIAIGPDGEAVLLDFTEGSLAAGSARLATDVATLLTAQAQFIGPDRAVRAALAELGAEAVLAAQPYLQGAALPRSLRPEPGVKETVAQLRRVVAAQTGTEAPPPAPIRRVQWRDALQTGLLLVAGYALLSMLIQLDWHSVFQTWQNATWAWVAVGVVVAQATSVVDAMSTMATVQTRLPLWPVVQLQYAIKLVGLAVSATAGRLALNTSLLKRFGEGPSVAVTATALDSFAGAVANAVVVLMAVLMAQSLPDVPVEGPDDLTWVLIALALALLVSASVILLVPRLRRGLTQAVRSVWSSMRIVISSPARGLLLFGTNFASLFITAISMYCMVEGLQPSLPYATVLAVTAAAALFASVIPVPGNVGVAEAAISAGLVVAGVPSGPAFAIAVTQRIATSYLPPLYGVWALRWLRNEDYVG